MLLLPPPREKIEIKEKRERALLSAGGCGYDEAVAVVVFLPETSVAVAAAVFVPPAAAGAGTTGK